MCNMTSVHHLSTSCLRVLSHMWDSSWLGWTFGTGVVLVGQCECLVRPKQTHSSALRQSCTAMLICYARKWSTKRWPEQQVTHLLECVCVLSFFSRDSSKKMEYHMSVTMETWRSARGLAIEHAKSQLQQSYNEPFFLSSSCLWSTPACVKTPSEQTVFGWCCWNRWDLIAVVNPLFVNLGPVVQGPRRMFQDPDSNTPPNTTANRPDQKPVAVTQPVVTQCVAVRNNNSSHESERISAERWSVRASPSLPDGWTCFVLLTVMKDYVTNKAWQRLFMEANTLDTPRPNQKLTCQRSLELCGKFSLIKLPFQVK